MSQLAKRIVDITTGEETDHVPEPTPEEERAAKGGAARAAKLTPEERSAIAKRRLSNEQQYAWVVEAQ